MKDQQIVTVRDDDNVIITGLLMGIDGTMELENRISEVKEETTLTDPTDILYAALEKMQCEYEEISVTDVSMQN